MTDDLSVTEIDKVKYDKIQKAKEFEKNVNEAIGIAKDLKEDVEEIKSVKDDVLELKKEICEGPDCLKERVKKIEDNMQYFRCENCGYSQVQPLSSYCPNCGSPIFEWNDASTGQPINGWEHFSKRTAKV